LKKIRKDMAKMFSMEDWENITIEEVKMRWENRRREIEEVEKRKREIDKKIEIRKKKKEERRKRAIRERRCFVCGIFGHMAHYCRNRGEKDKGSTQMPLNSFEVLKDRVMQRGEGSGRKIGKDCREILREEREKKIKVQKKDLGKRKVDNEKEKKREVEKKEKKKDDKKEEIEKEIEAEREVEMRGFSGGEILKGRYPLVWRKVQCYECGGLGHRRRDHGDKRKDKIEKEKKEIETKKIDKKQEIEEKSDKKEKKVKKDKKKRDIGVETEIVEEKEKRDIEIATEEEEIVKDKREIELKEQEDRVEERKKIV